jgi:hypothetical protein
MNFTRIALICTVAALALACKVSASTFSGSSITTNGVAAVNGSNLDLTNNGFNVIGSAFFDNPIILTPNTSFVSQFNFRISNDASQTVFFFQPYEGNGGGFSFIVQNCGGPAYTLGGDCSQIRTVFNADQGFPANPVIPFGTVDVEQNGGAGPFSPAQQFNLHSSLSTAGPGPYDVVTGTVVDSYDSSTHTYRVQATNSTGGSVDYSLSVNLYDLITQGAPPAPSTAYFGFGGASLGGRSQTEISGFSLSLNEGGLPSSSAPEPCTMLLCMGSAGAGWIMSLRRGKAITRE